MTAVVAVAIGVVFLYVVPTLRDSLIIIVSTRSLNLAEEAERSSRMATASARNLLGRAVVLNAAQGELADLIQFADSTSRRLLEQRGPSTDQERTSSQEERRRALLPADEDPEDRVRAGSPDGKVRP